MASHSSQGAAGQDETLPEDLAKCLYCKQEEEESHDTNWVECKTCKEWAHYSCAGVDERVAAPEVDWYCSRCNPAVTQQLTIPKPGKKGPKIPSGSKSDSGPTSGTNAANPADKQHEEEQQARKSAFMKEMAIRQNRLRADTEWKAKKMEMEQKMREMELDAERKLRELELEAQQKLQEAALKQEQELLDKQLAAENEFLKKREAIRSRVKSSLQKVQSLMDKDGAAKQAVPVKPATKVQSWLQNQNLLLGDKRGAYEKGGKPLIPGIAKSNADLDPNGDYSDFEGILDDDLENDGQTEVRSKAPSRASSARLGPGNRLTPDQIATRKVISKTLPKFNGDPIKWPQFISSFEYTTEACGFSNLENLDRLLHSLEGEALEAVRSTLILPESIPEVIRDLRKLFGQPEKLLAKLLEKAKKAPPPYKGKPESFTHFGIVVKQLCDHLEAANLREHLHNPLLVNQLALKLPANERFDWIEYMEGKEGTPLRVFASYVTKLGDVGARAAAFALIADHTEPRAKDKPTKKKEFVHVHDSASSKPVNEKQGEKIGKPCWICKRTDHRIRYCDDFRKLDIAERLKTVEKLKLCGICLNKHGENPCASKLRCATCKGNHHSLLHRVEESVQLQKVECNAHEGASRSVIFRMVPVTLHAGKRRFDTLAFLDEGSSTTLIDEVVAKQLKVNGEPEPLIVTWTGNINRVENGSQKVEMMLSARGSNDKIRLENVRTVSELMLPKQDLRFAEVSKQYAHLSGLPIKDYTAGQAAILVGLDNLHLFAPLESRVGKQNEPIAVRSKVGWMVYGPEKKRPSASTYLNLHSVAPASNQQLHDLMREQYMLDEAGVSSFALPESEEDRRAKAILQETTKLVGERFETGLLWRQDERRFPDSFPMAVRRMKALDKKLEKNPALKTIVCQQIEDYQVKGYAHQITEAELENTPSSDVWYIPLNVVLNPRKPDKVRMVWDAAANVDGVSLNTELLKGPDMLVPLLKVICQFRVHAVAYGGDIEAMYHQIKIRDEDKQAQRFLFRSNTSDQPQIFVMDVATFGSTCSPCSAQFVKNLNAERFGDKYPEAVKAIVDKHYVDDYYDSVDTVDEAIQRAKEVKWIHSQGGFHIRNWVSNSSVFLEELGERSGNEAVHFNRDKGAECERVLGIVWQPFEDVFSFTTLDKAQFQKVVDGEERPTKRMVLSFVMALFDPIGLINPITVRGKMLMQDLWRTGCDWNDRIDELSHEKWLRWVKMMRNIGSFKIPRCYFGDVKTSEIEDLQLHIFVDASETAYGCVAYFRAVVKGEVKCVLIMSRSKVAPLKMLSIPRLELLAAVLGARLARSVIEIHSLKINQVFYWTDANVVLSWIRSDQKRYKLFVAFRIGEIHSLSKPGEWRKVPTRLNVADLLTKWGKDPEMHPDSAWVRGPAFLYKNEQEWPKEELPPTNTTEELRIHLMLHEVKIPEALVDATRFSKWTVLVRTMATVFRFISNCRRKSKGLPIETLKPTERQIKAIRPSKAEMLRVPLRQAEYEKAECCLLRMAQAEGFVDELKVLKRNRDRPADQWIAFEKSSPLRKLTPLYDEEGLIRIEGRCERAEALPFDLRFPIILPADSRITKMIVQHYHERCGHGYRQTVKNKLRQLYHVVHADAVAKKVSSACMWCRVHRNRPQIPREAPLPVQRLTPDLRPFSFCGVDYMGPFDVTVGRRTEKRWIALFTCLATRAVHLEVAHGLTTQSCLMAIRRFICRRDWPFEFLSDNGTNFQGASKELLAQIQSIGHDCANEYTNARTKWTFNPPATPHMGGVWERLVRSVKEVLKALDDGRRLTDEILQTAIVEAEDIINSRPLTYVSQESDEAEALTPNHFLRGPPSRLQNAAFPPPHPAEALRDTYQRSQQLVSELWQRWITECVPSMNLRTKWFGEKRPMKAGDLVHVVEGSNRKCWVRAVVEEPIVSSDKRIRQAWVRTKSKRCRKSVANLAVMELDEGNAEPDAISG